MRLGNDTPASIRTLADAEYYALSPREQLIYLTRILLELDRVKRRTLRAQPNAEREKSAPAVGTYVGQGSFLRDSLERTPPSAIR